MTKKSDDAPIKAAKVEEPKPEHFYHPVLTNALYLEAQGKARKRLEAERTKAAMKFVEDQETDRLRLEEGLVVGGIADEMVNIIVDLAEYADRIVINHKPYFHGRTYAVPRHVADSMREIMFNTFRHQNDIDGKSIRAMAGKHKVATMWSTKGGGKVIGTSELH